MRCCTKDRSICRQGNESQITVQRLHDHRPQLGHHGQLRELHTAAFWYQTLVFMLSPTFGLKHWYFCFSSWLAYTLFGGSLEPQYISASRIYILCLNAPLLRDFFSCWSTFRARAYLGNKAHCDHSPRS